MPPIQDKAVVRHAQIIQTVGVVKLGVIIATDNQSIRVAILVVPQKILLVFVTKVYLCAFAKREASVSWLFYQVSTPITSEDMF